ncbi:hypothetical protein SO802_026700 [Lithocarpus litseifolius]|uniref:Zinc knuckle CX2CX4HX4C domain-containing protein n=1 Tax=Lithocarpus litseifolius TaxID=425828 RepID=A0AAW2C0A3_9ROSI
MEDLTCSWQKLSLSNKEGVNVDLSENRKVHGFALATKPLWRTKGSFQASDAKQNYMVFTFDVEEDVEKVLMGEPWSFDRHLVVFQRGGFQAGRYFRVSHKNWDSSDMRGGTFMRVRSLNILEPIYRGRRVTFGQNSKGWVSFSYVQLPNICYWCGRFTHDDKECTVWLQSKGSIVVEEQQFGAWFRATQFNPSRRSYVEVKGFEMEEAPRRVVVDKQRSGRVSVPPVVHSTVNSNGGVLGKEISNITDYGCQIKPQADFTETLKGIDDEIQRYKFSNSNSFAVMITKDTAKTGAKREGIKSSMEILDHAFKAMETDKDTFVEGKDNELNATEMMEFDFEMGWVEKNHLKRGGLSKTHVKDKTKVNGAKP